MFGKILIACCIVIFAGNCWSASSHIEQGPVSHVKTEILGTERHLGQRTITMLITIQDSDSDIDSLDEDLAVGVQHAIEGSIAEKKERIEYETNGLISKFLDLVYGARPKMDMSPLQETIYTIHTLLHTEGNGFQKQLIEGSDDFKAGLCLFACGIDHHFGQNQKINQLYQEIFSAAISKEDAFAKLKANAKSWGISDETFELLGE